MTDREIKTYNLLDLAARSWIATIYVHTTFINKHFKR